jgi:rhodanese-related sulfurtransferase
MAKIHQSSKPASPPKKARRRAVASASRIRTWLVIISVVVLAAVAYLLLRPHNDLPAEVDPAQAYALYQSGATFVDVRTEAEWATGHIPGSLLIPLDELPSRVNEIPRDKDIVVICKSGVRSKEGAAILRLDGFTRVTCLAGGIQAWAAMGYRIQQ